MGDRPVALVAPQLPPVAASRIEQAKRLLHRALGPSKLLFDRESCEPYARDESEADGRVPEIVVLADTIRDVRATLACASRAGVPVTPRAGGTGRTGGAVPVRGGIVLATLGMARILDIDSSDLLAVVEPGLHLGQLHHAVEREGLFYPPDPSSLDSCAIGGNVAENAGGPRTFKYGVTRDFVLGLDACLMDGTVLRSGRRTVKGVAGYDVTSLLVGSEGTLGVFTRITLRLIPLPPSVITLLVLFRSAADACRAVLRVVSAGLAPRCIELVDPCALEAIRAQGKEVDPRAACFLLVEVDGAAAACDTQAQRVGDVCTEEGALDVLVAQQGVQRDRIWAIRRELSPALRRLTRFKLAEDVVVPRSRMATLLATVEGLSAEHGLKMPVYGHAGDGNLHVNVLWDHEEQVPLVRCVVDKLMRDVVELGGTITGEHGVGVLKLPYLPLEQSPPLLRLQKRIRRVFDPRGLLNPGKIFAGKKRSIA